MADNEFTCPFCGQKATVECFFIDDSDWYQTVCQSCGEPSLFFESASDAVKAWQDEALKRGL